MAAMSKRRLLKQQRFKRDDLKAPTKALLPSHKLQCFSVACLDMPQLEFGDKAVLPPKILLELQCLKIPTPLLFMVRAAGVNTQQEESSAICGQQYCSVQEFSAPDGQIYLPYWLMQNLNVPEGGLVLVTSVVDIPRGIYCRLQPETMSFLALAADIGPKLLMETALRRYSVLSVDSHIVIEHGNMRYYVRVAELKPVSVVSLCGDVDLETDFMPPEGADPKRPTTGKLYASHNDTSVQSTTSGKISIIDSAVPPTDIASTSSICYGRRLRDGGYVISNRSIPAGTTASTLGKPSNKCNLKSLQTAQKLVRDKESTSICTDAVAAATDSAILASQLRSAQAAFSTPGFALGTAQQAPISNCSVAPVTVVKQQFIDNGSQVDLEQVARSDCTADLGLFTCKLCLTDISSINMELHALRCVKNPTYHKFKCSTCQEKVLRVNQYLHLHCPVCAFLCKGREELTEHEREEHSASCKCTFCSLSFTRAELQDHVDNERCDHALVPCLLCGLAFKKKSINQHNLMCSSRTERCDICKSFINITELQSHEDRCKVTAAVQDHATPNPIPSVVSPPRVKASHHNDVECAYCLQGGFANIAAVEHHALNDCRIAKSFVSSESVHIARSNQEEVEPAHAASSENTKEPHCSDVIRPLLAQGRMRRKDDTNALRGDPPSPQEPPLTRGSRSNQARYLSTPLSIYTPAGPSRRTHQAGKLRKPKPRPNPQLRALPQRTQDTVSTFNGPRVTNINQILSSGPAELCISSAGGTSHRALAPTIRSQGPTRLRRRATSNFPPPGGLDKLA